MPSPGDIGSQTAEPDDKALLSLLQSVERDGSQSQRRFAADVGIALGLVNAYLKRCIRKGLVKVSEAPARRYSYYLTPQGFAEKSRLTARYLSVSLSFFRQARTDCASAIDVAKSRGWTRLVLVGASDLAEIALICAMERQIEIIAIVDESALPGQTLLNVPVVTGLAGIDNPFDGVLITAVDGPGRLYSAMADAVGHQKVLVPSLLGVNTSAPGHTRTPDLQEDDHDPTR